MALYRYIALVLYEQFVPQKNYFWYTSIDWDTQIDFILLNFTGSFFPYYLVIKIYSKHSLSTIAVISCTSMFN